MDFLDFLRTDFFSHSNRNFEEKKAQDLDYKNTFKIFNVPYWLERVTSPSLLNSNSLNSYVVQVSGTDGLFGLLAGYAYYLPFPIDL